MNILLVISLEITLIVTLLILLIISWTTSETSTQSNDPFECGMELFNIKHTPFYIHYYLIGVLFLIFDLEFIVSIPMLFMSCLIYNWMLVWFIYFFVMFLGVLVEVWLGTLDWKM
uniref:NADH-ubiquinone oxidoreductase chain 3 n=1 Tax=Trichodectes canis TaxID=209909 RepID=A0A386B2H4_9NEOP|nr:NADH dehydrogenase subunit 3 [Trichodectes canis]